LSRWIIKRNEGSIVVEVQGLEKNINQAVDFIKKYNFAIEEKEEFFF